MQLLLRLKQHDRAYLRSLLGRPSIYDQHFAQQPRETSHLIRFVSRRQPQQPRLRGRILGARGNTALNEAAFNGHAAVVEQLISAGAKVDAANNDGRGPGRVRPLAGDFRAVLWDVEWYSYLLFKDPLL